MTHCGGSEDRVGGCSGGVEAKAEGRPKEVRVANEWGQANEGPALGPIRLPPFACPYFCLPSSSAQARPSAPWPA